MYDRSLLDSHGLVPRNCKYAIDFVDSCANVFEWDEIRVVCPGVTLVSPVTGEYRWPIDQSMDDISMGKRRQDGILNSCC